MIDPPTPWVIHHRTLLGDFLCFPLFHLIHSLEDARLPFPCFELQNMDALFWRWFGNKYLRIRLKISNIFCPRVRWTKINLDHLFTRSTFEQIPRVVRYRCKLCVYFDTHSFGW